MQKLLLIILAFLVILTILYIPDLFPLCCCCKRKKLRPFFRIHMAVSISPGYRGSRSVCSKCCKRYDLKDLKDLDRFIRASRKVKIKQLSRDL